MPPMSYERHRFYERDIHSVTANKREDGRVLLEVASQIPVRPKSTVCPLEEAKRALQDLKTNRINTSGVLQIG